MRPSKGTLWFWLAVILTVAVVGTTAFFRLQPPPQVDPSTIPRQVDMLTLMPQPVEVAYTAQGTIEAANRVELNVETPGTVVEIAFREGEPVQQGRLLIRLRAAKQQAQELEASAALASSEGALSASHATLSKARADLTAAKAEQALAESEYRRYQQLFEEEMVSALERDQKRAAFETQAARLKASRQELHRVEADLKQAHAMHSEAEARLSYNRALASETVIRAPFPGTIGQKYVDLGDYVLPGEKLLTLVDNRQLRVAFDVPERYIPLLKKGLSVMLVPQNTAVVSKTAIDFDVDFDIPGTVDFVDSAVEPTTRTVKVKAVLEPERTEGASSLLDGQFAQVRLILGTTSGGMVLPEQAVIPQGEKYFVYVAASRDTQSGRTAGRSGKTPRKADPGAVEAAPLEARFREVTLGERGTGWVQVTQGLDFGERVVVSGLQKLFDGAPLQERKTPRLKRSQPLPEKAGP